MSAGIEYGAFAINKKTGKEELIFRTEISDRICLERGKEHVGYRNVFSGEEYDPDSLRVMYRKVETKYYDWKKQEKEAYAQGDPWYEEIWTDEDLEAVLDMYGIPCTPENIALVKCEVKGDAFQSEFRNLMLKIFADKLDHLRFFI